MRPAVVGLAATALVLRHVGGERAAWAVAEPLLLAGLGGGMVTSPNGTLTLASVPVRMAGAAGGALQTAQRIGAAVRQRADAAGAPAGHRPALEPPPHAGRSLADPVRWLPGSG